VPSCPRSVSSTRAEMRKVEASGNSAIGAPAKPCRQSDTLPCFRRQSAKGKSCLPREHATSSAPRHARAFRVILRLTAGIDGALDRCFVEGSVRLLFGPRFSQLLFGIELLQLGFRAFDVRNNFLLAGLELRAFDSNRALRTAVLSSLPTVLPGREPARWSPRLISSGSVLASLARFSFYRIRQSRPRAYCRPSALI